MIISTAAATFGTHAHSLVEDIIADKVDRSLLDPTFAVIADGYDKWKEDYSFLDIVHTEIPVYSLEHGYAGIGGF